MWMKNTLQTIFKGKTLVTYFSKEVKPSLAKPPFHGGLA